MDPLTIAVVDVGSNAIRFLAARVAGDDEIQAPEVQRAAVRLGTDAFARGRLSEPMLDAAIAALRGFRQRMDALGVVWYRAVATSAVRESANADDLVHRAWEEAGLRLEVLSDADEARLVWRALRTRLPRPRERWAMVDLGGGSVEVSLAVDGEPAWSLSEALGTVRLAQEIGTGADAAERVRERLRPLLDEITRRRGADRPVGLAAAGGNVEALAELFGQPAAGGARRLPRAALREGAAQLMDLSIEEREQRFGLAPDRADVIAPAAVVYGCIADALEVEELLVPGVGLREGVLLQHADSLRERARRSSSARVALFSDVHGNALALRAALQMAVERGAGRVVVAGDLVGDGPHPVEVARMLRAAGTLALRGNVDRKVLRYAEKKKKKLHKRLEGKNPSRANRAWSALQLRGDSEAHEWLRALPPEQRFELEGTDVLVVHGSPVGDTDRILCSLTAEALAAKLEPADDPRPRVLACGHTHAGFVREVDGVLVVNCGSAGRPADGDPRGSLVILELEGAEPRAELLRFDYPVEALARDLEEREVPGVRAAEYRGGVKR